MLKQILHIVFFLCAVLNTEAQFYIRGEIKDEKNQPLQNVKILSSYSHQLYSSGYSGGFGIISKIQIDTLNFSLEGYETKKIKVNATQWQNIILKLSSINIKRNRPKLISITKDLKQNNKFQLFVNNETYFQIIENESINTSKFPNTGFSINVNKASYSNIRRFINMGSTVPPDAVRTEELLNYFNFNYKVPEGDEVFKTSSQLTSCPWNNNKQLLFININAKKLELNKIPAGNFVFLIDVSGSMDMPNRLSLLKAAFQLFVNNLRPIDTVSIVTYGGAISIHLPPTSGSEKVKILASIEELEASGDTPGEGAIRMAYKLAENSFIKGGTNRIILATDGDFNVGAASEKALDEMISKEKLSGVYLTCLGVGMGNFKDSKLETLAKRGNGNYAYLDDINEAEKVLVKELTQTFYAVAQDVYMNIQFNPKLVKEYRLIGFDNKRDAIADSTIDIEGGEVGSGSSVMAVFELVPENNLLLNNKENLAQLSMRYQLCNDTIQQKFQSFCKANFIPFENIDNEIKFATAVTMFGLKLKQSIYLNNASWEEIEAIAKLSYNPNNYLQNQFLELLEKVQKIYKNKKNKKVKLQE